MFGVNSGFLVSFSGFLVSSAYFVGISGFVAFLTGLVTVTMRRNFVVNSFKVVQCVVVACYYMVYCVGSWLAAQVADTLISF